MRKLLLPLLALLCSLSLPVWAAHAYALFGDIKYPIGFTHFDYVNPQAPKGGEVVLVSNNRQSNFDRYNPFILKGEHPPGMANEGKNSSLIFESLLTGSADEPATMYGLLAEDVVLAADFLSAVYRLHPKARFHNGDNVLADDVKYAFDRQTSQEASPRQRILWADIQSVTVLGERLVRFNFKKADKNLVLAAGSMPVFSRKWGAGKKFDDVVTDIPIGSGPYKIGKVNFGKDISYERDPSYWARDLPVRKGMYNFDRVSFKIYTDDTARLEAFKAGEFDLLQENIARRWARQYTGSKFTSGELVKKEFPEPHPGFYQGYVFNLRRPIFQDIRVRKALALALDFDWMNRQLFYNSYQQFQGFFPTDEYTAKGKPLTDELALLEPMRSKLSPAVFGDLPVQPSTKSPRSLRANLLEAQALLKAAGWIYREGALRNVKDEKFEFEFLFDQASLVRVLTPYQVSLAKLGVNLKLRVVDAALAKKRTDAFDFDMTSIALGSGALPGSDLKDLFAAESARTVGNLNYWGIQDAAVDVLLEKIVAANTRADLAAAVRSLDRVLAHGHYGVHNWFSPVYRAAIAARKFGYPQPPPYYGLESWAIGAWWATSAELVKIQTK